MVGNSLGLNYEIPQVQGGGLLQPSQAEIAAQQPFQQANNVPILPDINQDMAYKEGINDHLFNSYATLKRFAEDMNAKGIDVTKPDYSMPGGGDLYKTYKKLEADIYMTVDDLKRESDYEKQLAPQLMDNKVGYVEGFDPRTQFASQMNPQEVYFNKQLLPEVEFANKQLGESLYTPQDVKRFNETYLYGPNSTMSKLKASLDNPNITPAQKAQIQFNIDALGKAAQQTGLSQLDGDGGSGDVENLGLVKKVASLTSGNIPEGEYVFDDTDGDLSATTNQLEGYAFGETTVPVEKDGTILDRKVTRYIKNIRVYPDGRTYFEFRNNDVTGEPVPPVRVDNQAGDLLIASILDSNKGVGSGKKTLETMLKKGLLGKEGGLVKDRLFGEDNQTVNEMGKALKSTLREKMAGVQTAEKINRDQLERIPAKAFGLNSVDYKTPNGTVITVARGNKGYYIDGGSNPMTLDQVMAHLKKNKVFTKFAGLQVTDTRGQQPQSTTQQVQTEPKQFNPANF